MPPTPSHRRAFSLMELVIAVLIMGILAAVAAPRFTGSLCELRAEAAAKRIAADLNYARRMAMTTESRQRVHFYTNNVTDPNDQVYELMDQLHLDHSDQAYVVDLGQSAYPARITSVAFTNSNGFTAPRRMQFDIFGVPAAGQPPGDPLAPLVSGQVVVTLGTAQRTVVVNAVTGEASIQ